MLTLKSVWGHKPRPWGYEVRAIYLDAAGREHNECLTFPTEPDRAKLAAEVEARRAELDTRLADADVAPLDPVEEAAAVVKAEYTAQLAVNSYRPTSDWS